MIAPVQSMQRNPVRGLPVDAFNDINLAVVWPYGTLCPQRGPYRALRSENEFVLLAMDIEDLALFALPRKACGGHQTAASCPS